MGSFFVNVQFLKALIPQKACGLDCILVIVPKNCDPELTYILDEFFNTCLTVSFSQIVRRSHMGSHVCQNDGKRFAAKNHCRPAILLSVDGKIFEKLPNNGLVNYMKKCGLFSKFSMVSGLLNQLQIFCQIYLIELVGLLIGLGLLILLHLIYPRLSLAFLTNSSLIGF